MKDLTVQLEDRPGTLADLAEALGNAGINIEGIAGFISLLDEDNRRARSVVLWETKEGADEGERQFAAKREEIVRGMGGTVRSADLYEAPIVEVTAGARA